MLLLILHLCPNLSLSLPSPSDNSDLRQQLSALSVGQKLKLTVDAAKDSGATFKSDDLAGATILATKHHVMGMYLTRSIKICIENSEMFHSSMMITTVFATANQCVCHTSRDEINNHIFCWLQCFQVLT